MVSFKSVNCVRNFQRFVISLLGFSLLGASTLLGCTSGKNEQVDDSEEFEEEVEEVEDENILKDYINTPKDKAREVKGKLEDAQNEAQKQLRSLDD